MRSEGEMVGGCEMGGCGVRTCVVMNEGGKCDE